MKPSLNKSAPTTPVASIFAHSRVEQARGIVQSVDIIGRDLTVLLPSGIEVFDIPPGCDVVLHGELVKLRMIQPQDRVCIVFRRTPERLVAELLKVQPEIDVLPESRLHIPA
jgi:hypothetical protein